jgi:hypothetical protein
MDVLCLPIGGRPVVRQAVIHVKNEKTGSDTTEESKSPFFLPESHSLLVAAEHIGQAMFVAVDPAAERE